MFMIFQVWKVEKQFIKFKPMVDLTGTNLAGGYDNAQL